MAKIVDGKKQNVVSPLAAWAKRRRFISRLEALDNRLLDDIGFQRFQIKAAAEEAFPRVSLKAYAAVLVATLRENIKQANAARRLAALDDRMLADIGLRRSEIPGAIRGDMPVQAFAMPSIMSVSRAELVHSIPGIDVARVSVPLNDDGHRIAA